MGMVRATAIHRRDVNIDLPPVAAIGPSASTCYLQVAVSDHVHARVK
jgi:hypothetical protein